MKTLPILVAASFLAVASQAQTFTASLSGANERPSANASLATGTASVSIDSNNLLTYSVSYSGLVPSAAHLHAAAGVGTGTPATAGVVVPFTLTSSAGDAGLFSGTATITDTVKSLIIAGDSYANIHSAAFPGGEIRGQLVVVPEPGTLALLALGASVVAMRMRRKA